TDGTMPGDVPVRPDHGRCDGHDGAPDVPRNCGLMGPCWHLGGPGLDISLSHDDGNPLELRFDDAHGVLVKDLALDLRIRGEAPDCREDLRPEALFALSQGVSAIASEHQLILVALEELAGLILVAKHGIQA